MTELLARHGHSPRKRLGQHFLADQNMIDKIVALAGDPTRTRALEIGAGTGTLTRALHDAGFAVTAYEVDGGLSPLLREVLGDTNVDIRMIDATTIKPTEYATGRWVLVANLPYNIGTPIVLDMLRHAAGVSRCVVMVQREVADRLTAAPGSKEYGLPTVVVGLYGKARREFKVPRQVFVPPPNVESAVVSIDRLWDPDPIRERAVQIAAAGFGQRRKMLRTSLRAVVADVDATLESAGIDPTKRAEALTPVDYLEIAAAVSA